MTSITLLPHQVRAALKNRLGLLLLPVDGCVEVPGPYSEGAWERGEMPRFPFAETWVREEWTDDLPSHCTTCRDECGCRLVGYRADGAVHQCTVHLWDKPLEFTVSDFNDRPEWKPAASMPEWASRLSPRLVPLEVRHLTTLTISEAVMTGIETVGRRGYRDYDPQIPDGITPPSVPATYSAQSVWEILHPEYPWQDNYAWFCQVKES